MADNTPVYFPGITKPSYWVVVEVDTGDYAHVITLLEAAVTELKSRSEMERHIGTSLKAWEYGNYCIRLKRERDQPPVPSQPDGSA